MNPHILARQHFELLNNSKTKKSKPEIFGLYTFPVTPKFKVELSFQQKIYFPGENVPFNLKVSNPEGLHIEKLHVSLVQNTTHISIGKGKPIGVDVESNRIVGVDGPGLSGYSTGNDIEWSRALQIPDWIKPTMLDPALLQINGRAPKSIVDLRNVLQVVVYNCNIGEEVNRKVVEDFPIQIGKRGDISLSQSPDGSQQTAEIFNQIPPSFMRINEGQRDENAAYPYGRLDIDNRFQPPRYSTLTLAKGSHYGSTTSFETLPPNYDDITFEEPGNR